MDRGLQAFGQRRDGHYVLKLSGRIDLANVGEFEEALRSAAALPDRLVVVDMSDIDSIDSTGITALIEAEKAARADADRILFSDRFQPEVEAVLRQSGVYEELQVIEAESLPQSNDR